MLGHCVIFWQYTTLNNSCGIELDHSALIYYTTLIFKVAVDGRTAEVCSAGAGFTNPPLERSSFSKGR